MTQRMYIGPSRPYGLPLMQNAIILDVRGVAGLKDALIQHPELDQLLVPITELAQSKNAIKEKGSVLYEAYKIIQKEREANRGGK